VLAYIESFRGVSRGQKVWQMGFGSGFKVNSAVWKVRVAFMQHTGMAARLTWGGGIT
jgi:hypothetical protein